MFLLFIALIGFLCQLSFVSNVWDSVLPMHVTLNSSVSADLSCEQLAWISVWAGFVREAIASSRRLTTVRVATIRGAAPDLFFIRKTRTLRAFLARKEAPLPTICWRSALEFFCQQMLDRTGPAVLIVLMHHVSELMTSNLEVLHHNHLERTSS